MSYFAQKNFLAIVVKSTVYIEKGTRNKTDDKITWRKRLNGPGWPSL